MVDENRFDELAEKTDSDSRTEDSSTATEQPADDDSSEEHSISMPDSSQQQPSIDERSDTTTGTSRSDGPYLAASETDQRPMYAAVGTWEAFDDAVEIEIQRALRDRGHRDVLKREITDQVLAWASENPDAVAELVAQRRESRR